MAPGGGPRSLVERLLDRDNPFVFVWVLQLGAIILFTPLDTRILGVERFGEVAAAMALAQGVYALSGLLLQPAIRRRYDEEGPDRARRLTLWIVLLAAGTTAVAYVSGSWWSGGLGFRHFGGAPRWAVLWGGLMAVTGTGLALLKSQDRLRAFGAVSLLQSVGAQILAVTFVLGLQRTPSMFVLGLLAGQAATAAVAVGAAQRSGPTHHHAPRSGDPLTHYAPLVPGVIAALVLGVADRLVLQAKLGSVAVGRYQLAYNVGAPTIALLGALSLVWLPRILGTRDERARAAIVTHRRNLAYLILVPVIVGVCVGGQLLLDGAGPRSYGTHGLLIVLTLLVMAAVPCLDGLTSSCILISAGQTRTLAWALALAAGVDIDLNLVLVPIWHLAGSAAATLLSYAIMAALLRWRARRELRLGRLPWTTCAELIGAAGLVLLWSQAPATAPWIALRVANVGACAIWFALITRALVAEQPASDQARSTPRPQLGRIRLRRPWGRATSDEATSDEAKSMADESQGANGRLRRGLPAGLLDSGFSSLSSFLMGLIATHYLLPTELGEYAIFYSAFALAAVIPATMIFTPIEVSTLDLPLDQRLSVIRRSLPLGGVTGLISGLIVCGVVVPIVTQVGLAVRLEFALTVVVISCVSPAQDHLRRMFHQSGRSWIAARMSVIQTVTVAVVIVAARLVEVPLALVPFGALVLGNVVSGIAGSRLAPPEPGDGRSVLGRTIDIVRSGVWLTVGTAYGFAAGLATVTILADRSSAAAAGQTEAARVLSQPVTVVAIGILAVFGPEMMSAGQRGESKRVNKMMLGFVGVVAAATLLWLVAVGIPWPWSPITRIFSTAYAVQGLTALTIVQQALAYGSLAYRAVVIGSGAGHSVGKLDMFASTVAVVGVYVMAPYLHAYSIVWAFLGVDLLLFGMRARMASRAVRAAGAALPLPPSLTTSLDS